MPVVWCHKGQFSGTIIEVATQADADRAEAEGWGQDMARYSGHQLIVHELDPVAPPPELNNELPPEGEQTQTQTEGAAQGGEYQTRHLEAEQPGKRGPGRPPKAKD